MTLVGFRIARGLLPSLRARQRRLRRRRTAIGARVAHVDVSRWRGRRRRLGPVISSTHPPDSQCRQNVGIWLLRQQDSATKAVVWCRRRDSFWESLWRAVQGCPAKLIPLIVAVKGCQGLWSVVGNVGIWSALLRALRVNMLPIRSGSLLDPSFERPVP